MNRVDKINYYLDIAEAVAESYEVTTEEDDDFIYSTVPLGILFKDNIFMTVYYKENEVIHSFIRWKKIRRLEEFSFHNLYLSLFCVHQCVHGICQGQTALFAKSFTISAFSQWLYLSRWLCSHFQRQPIHLT